MAKKKKRPSGSRPRPQQRPAGGTPQTNRPSNAKREAAEARRQAAADRRKKAQQRKRRRTIALITAAVLIVAGLIGWRVQMNRTKNAKASELSAAAGCTEVKKGSTTGAQEHLQPGQTTKYDSSPPTHGGHAPETLSAGVYNDPLSDENAPGPPSIYKAVHSLEHGYVIVWHNGLGDKELDALTDKFRHEKKVIIVPYPKLAKGKTMALTSWGRVQTCTKADPRLVTSFVDRFREHKDAPEPVAA